MLLPAQHVSPKSFHVTETCVLGCVQYPSAMISANLSHETFVTDPSLLEGLTEGVDYHTVSYENWEYVKTGKGDAYTKRISATEPIKHCTWVLPKKDAEGKVIESSRGLIPRVLIRLLAERKATKKRMAKEPDAFKAAILDSVQLALKIVANSVRSRLLEHVCKLLV